MKSRKWGWVAAGLVLMGLLALGVFAAAVQAQPPPGDPAKGKAVYDKSCALCHGAGAVGGVGPTLAGAAGHVQQLGIPPAELGPGMTKLLREGINGRMPGFPPALLSDEDMANLGAYLFTLPPTTGQNLYESASSCAACHGPKGVGGIAARLEARKAASTLGLTKEQLLPGLIPLVRNGIPGRMPAFRHLTDGEIMSIGEYLWDLPGLSWEEEFALRHGRAPTGEDILDRDWGNRFMLQNGRDPTEEEWRKHYNERKGLGYR